MAKKDIKSDNNLYLTDSMIKEKSKEGKSNNTNIIGVDALSNPFYEKRDKWLSKYSNDKRSSKEIYIPAQDLIPRNELYYASLTPKGSFICRVSIKFAFFQGWKYTKSLVTHEPLETDLSKKLHKIDKNFYMKDVAVRMMRVSSIFGRSLVYIQENDVNVKSKTKFILRVSPIFEEQITYDDITGYPIKYEPYVAWGKSFKQIEVAADKGVLVIWDLDEFGNLSQGIPALISSYETICREEQLSNDYISTVSERGLGFVDILAKGAKNLKDLKKIRQAFRIGEDRVFVHGPQYEATAKPGVQSGFSFDDSKGRLTKDISSSTGYPSMAVEGVQVGAVTGSETDQDNRAQMYRIIQEMAEPYLEKIQWLIDGDLLKEEYEFEWDFEIKEDRGRKAQIMSTFAAGVNQIQDLITVDQSLNLLQLPLLGGEDGKMLLSHWISDNSPVIDTLPTDPNKVDNGMKNRINSVEDNKNNSKDKKENANDSKQIEIEKRSTCKRLLLNGDSYTTVNETLMHIYESGLSYSTIVEMKKELKI